MHSKPVPILVICQLIGVKVEREGITRHRWRYITIDHLTIGVHCIGSIRQGGWWLAGFLTAVASFDQP